MLAAQAITNRKRKTSTSEFDEYGVKRNETDKLDLWTHQRETVKVMRARELRLWNHVEHDDSRCLEKRPGAPYYKNVGLLTNDMASGKTLSYICHVTNHPRIVQSFEKELLWYTPLPLTLVSIVEQYAVSDWQEFLQRFLEQRQQVEYQFLHQKRYHEYVSPLLSMMKSTRLIEPTAYLLKLELVRANLTVVPSSVFWQWKREIQSKFAQSKRKRAKIVTAQLKYDFIERKEHTKDVQQFRDNDLLICTASQYTAVARLLNSHHILLPRVAFDEVHSIKISACPSVDAIFYWGITTTYPACHRIRHHGFLNDMFASLSLPNLKKLCTQVKSSSFDRKANQYPPFQQTTIVCKTSPLVSIFQKSFPNSTLCKLLHQELWQESYHYLLANPDIASSGFHQNLGGYITLKVHVCSWFSSLFRQCNEAKQLYREHLEEKTEPKARLSTNNRKQLRETAHEMEQAKDAAFAHPPSSVPSLLELQLASLHVKWVRKSSPNLLNMAKMYAFLRVIGDEEICMRCLRKIQLLDQDQLVSAYSYPFDPKMTKESGSVHTSCCHLNYCLACAPFVTECCMCGAHDCKHVYCQCKQGITPWWWRPNLTREDLQMKEVLSNFLQFRVPKLEDNPYKKTFQQEFEQIFSCGDQADVTSVVIRAVEHRSRQKKRLKRSAGAVAVAAETSTQSNAERKVELNQEISNLDTRIISQFVDCPCTFITNNTLTKDQVLVALIRRHCLERKDRTLVVSFGKKPTANVMSLLKQTFAPLVDTAAQIGHAQKLSIAELKGNLNVIPKLIDRFSRGEIQVMVLNAQTKGEGLDLPSCDVMIICYVDSEAALLQVIGRAQRPDRTTTLQVYKLEFAAKAELTAFQTQVKDEIFQLAGRNPNELDESKAQEATQQK